MLTKLKYKETKLRNTPKLETKKLKSKANISTNGNVIKEILTKIKYKATKLKLTSKLKR